jgi:hypothetical protein
VITPRYALSIDCGSLIRSRWSWRMPLFTLSMGVPCIEPLTSARM